MVVKRLELNTPDGCVGIAVIVDGVPLPIYEYQGRFYTPAPLGKDYEIELFVPVDGRYLFVGSVDGLSIMDGKRASVSDSGYVVTYSSGRGANRIPGFRLDNQSVAHFQFLSSQQSYAALMDKPENIGVIGFAVYSEFRPIQLEVERSFFSSNKVTRGETRSAGTYGHNLSLIHI